MFDTYFRNRTGDESAGAEFTHFDRSGRPKMVDVSGKDETLREAYALGEIIMAADTLTKIMEGGMAKGDVLTVAQVAAIMAVKDTGRLIPMAHPLGISGVEVDFVPVFAPDPKVEIGVRVKLTGQTGVEMEALTGVSVAALTIYDMCKAVDKDMVIQNIRLVEKKGGRSGHYRRDQK
ncbi:MAG: cyclic pyranopterin monophosphate synthase MoaC [Bacillota bacterium]|nr:cyclic pyranopterin monophosphate synthase MoaC [Bacillota bacterium]